MRAAFGKVNTLHNHVLPWIDRPLVTQNLVGGEEGINDAGLSLSRILPAPKGLSWKARRSFFAATARTFSAPQRRNDVSTVGHLRAYSDLNESTNLESGASYARGHSPSGRWLESALRRRRHAALEAAAPRRSITRSWARSEFIWSRTTVSPSHVPEASLSRTAEKPFGFYVSGDYQFGRRWFLGGRFDRSERVTDALALRDTGGSLVLTYWPSEFSQIRGQLRRTRYGEGLTANEFLFQFQFSMGAHGAHPF